MTSSVMDCTRAAARLALTCMLLQLLCMGCGISSSMGSAGLSSLGRHLHQAEVALPKFPWHYVELPGFKRWWDEGLLSAATTHANYRQLDSLLYKLINKKGITVLLLGSSVVADFGGCWPRHNHTKAKSMVQDPGIVYVAKLCERFGQGWGSAFMELLDQAFPGNDNVIINAGRNALPLYGIMQIGCLEAHLPKDRRPDLVIVENHEPSIENYNAAWYVERIIWRILAHPFGPPLGPAGNSNSGSSGSSSSSSSSSSSGSSSGNTSGGFGNTATAAATPATSGQASRDEALSVVPAVIFMNVINSPRPACLNASCAGGTVEDEITQLLSYYGFGAVSTRQFLREAARRSAATQPDQALADMTQKSESVLADHVHPSGLGKVMMSDILLQHLFDAYHSLTASNRARRSNMRVLLNSKSGNRYAAGGRVGPVLEEGGGDVLGEAEGEWDGVRGDAGAQRQGLGAEIAGVGERRTALERDLVETSDAQSVAQGGGHAAQGAQQLLQQLQQQQQQQLQQRQRPQVDSQRQQHLQVEETPRDSHQVSGGSRMQAPGISLNHQTPGDSQQQVSGDSHQQQAPGNRHHQQTPGNRHHQQTPGDRHQQQTQLDSQQQTPGDNQQQVSGDSHQQTPGDSRQEEQDHSQRRYQRRRLRQQSGLWSRPPVPRSLPAQSFVPGGRDLWSMRCYGHLVDGHNFHDTPLGNLHILENKGFEYSEYQVHGSSRKFKPGWIAMTPGSRLVFRVDSAFMAAGQQSWTQAKAQVSLLMLWSYEHMGRAKLSCVSGCTCLTSIVDFHETKERHSLLKDHSFEVSQHPECDIELLVLPETSSGEHKVKLVQVVAKVPVGNQATSR